MVPASATNCARLAGSVVAAIAFSMAGNAASGYFATRRRAAGSASKLPADACAASASRSALAESVGTSIAMALLTSAGKSFPFILCRNSCANAGAGALLSIICLSSLADSSVTFWMRMRCDPGCSSNRRNVPPSIPPIWDPFGRMISGSLCEPGAMTTIPRIPSMAMSCSYQTPSTSIFAKWIASGRIARAVDPRFWIRTARAGSSPGSACGPVVASDNDIRTPSTASPHVSASGAIWAPAPDAMSTRPSNNMRQRPLPTITDFFR